MPFTKVRLRSFAKKLNFTLNYKPAKIMSCSSSSGWWSGTEEGTIEGEECSQCQELIARMICLEKFVSFLFMSLAGRIVKRTMRHDRSGFRKKTKIVMHKLK